MKKDRSLLFANLKRNWFFPISAMAFFCLNAMLNLAFFIGLLIAFLASLAAASHFPSLPDLARQGSKRLRVISLATALGICWAGQVSFCEDWDISSKTQALEAMLPSSIDLPVVVSVFGAVVAVYFVYLCVLVFWRKMGKIISASDLFCDITPSERVVYGLLLAASLALVVFSFARSNAFYGSEFATIYTGDSPNLVKGNVYMIPTHTENDIRQPLFAVFAAPFVGIPYLLGRLLGTPFSVQTMLVNSVQVAMLYAAHFLLAKMMKLSPAKRLCFMLLASCTYTHLLFTLMMEQYIVAYFWLCLSLYLISEKRCPDKFVLYGVGGTLLTGMVLMPFFSEKHPVRDLRGWFSDMVKFGLEFVALMLLFCRFDTILELPFNLPFLTRYSGKGLTWMEKLCQYLAFLPNCFAAPDAGVNTTATFPYISWQLAPITEISAAGLVILLLVLVSVILNREKKSSLLAAGWCVFSAAILLLMGWGTAENGLILYSLYFGWSFLVLLFQLVEKIEEKLRAKFLVPLLSVAGAISLAAVNLPAILEMVSFAATYYPA